MKLAITFILGVMISLSHYSNIEEATYDYYEAIELAKESNKPIFLFFTGRNCENPLQVNKLIENDKEMWSKVKEKFVLVILYVDDETKLSKEKLVERNGAKIRIRTKGNEWAHIEITKYNNNIQPLMVIVNSEEEIIKPPLFGKLNRDRILEYIEN